MDSKARIQNNIAESIQTKMLAADNLIEQIAAAGKLIVQGLLSDCKVLSCGHGSSAVDAQRFTANLLGRYKDERPSLPAFALTIDDYNLDDVFAKQVKALGQAGDVLLAISTSGNAKNILNAIEAAHQRGMSMIALTGFDGGELASMLNPQDIEIRVPAQNIARVQETHLLIIHCICDMIDHKLFQNEEELA